MTELKYEFKEFKFLSFDELMETPDPEFQIQGLIDMNTTCMLYGASGTGKTFVALSMAHAISTGSDWMGHKCKKGKVLYIYGEGAQGIKLRCKALKTVRESFGDIMFLGQKVDFLGTIDGELMAKQLIEADFNPDLVVIDTLARTFGSGRENDTDQMNQYINHLDTMREKLSGCTVLILHHTGKAKGKGPRGASSLTAALDTSIECKLTKVGKKKNITLSQDKEKDLDDFKPIQLHLRPVALPGSRGSLAAFPGPVKIELNDLEDVAPPQLSEKKQLVLTFFALASIPIARSACIDACKEPDKAPGQYFKAISELLNEGYLEQIGTGRNSPISITETGLEVSLSLNLVSEDQFETAKSQFSSVPTHPIGWGQERDGEETKS